jgi:hypothetical protein
MWWLIEHGSLAAGKIAPAVVATGLICGDLVLAAEPSAVRISEIMYHPASEDTREEFVELWNIGSSNVSLAGWQFTGGIRYAFSNDAVLLPGEFLVVASDRDVLTNKYPGLTRVVGNWEGLLSNSSDDLDLDDATGNRVDSVRYADEGNWARRWRGVADRGHQGVVWNDLHDGQDHSLEWIQPLLSNNHGQNWAASETVGGTPGRLNSVARTNIAPLVLDVRHFPIVPRSTDTVALNVELLDERTDSLTAWLHWRVDGEAPGGFESLELLDDGLHEDGVSGDGVFGTLIPAQEDGAVVEFYVEAQDAQGNSRIWPMPVIEEDEGLTQDANCLFQVDDTEYMGAQPLYKLILRETDRAELYEIGHSTNGEQKSDAQFNTTFVSVDGTGVECRYLVGVRNRGHGSRSQQPNNYRVNFRSDAPWKGVTAININGQMTFLQHLGSALCLKAGVPTAETRPVQLRVNNANLGDNGPDTYGTTYVALEVMNSEFARHRFPEDSSGNVYKAIRDIAPSDFAWRGDDPDDYRNTWFKSTNESEDDWSDLLGMLRVLGTNDLYSLETALAVADVDEWLRYLAVMALFDNRETSPNTGYNDDYYSYAGVSDPRFVLIPHDLDTILGSGGGSSGTSSGVLGVTRLAAFEQFLETPEFETAYYQTLRRLMETTFSAENYDAAVEQALAGFVPTQVLTNLRNWMDGRRAHVHSLLPPDLAPDPPRLTMALEGVPRKTTPFDTATIRVGGEGIDQYRYALDGAVWSDPQNVAVDLVLNGLASGSHELKVIGGTAADFWQDDAEATLVSWEVDPAWSPIRINEILAHNDAAVPHEGTYPDLIELSNEATVAVDLSGMRLTDDLTAPDKFVFPAGVTLEPGDFLALYANDPDGTGGLHTGFSLSADGEGVYLLDREDRGGAVLDSVLFGLQLADFSLGREGGREWFLGHPSPGAVNGRVELGDRGTLQINEWLADGRTLYQDDFVELYNPSPFPVALGGLWLTDNITSALDRHVITPLSFIGPQACVAFRADGEVEKGADHLSFKLAAEQGEIGLFTEGGVPIDRVIYGPQRTDISQGRQPSGAVRLADFLMPTPGALNPGSAPELITEILELVTLTNVWSYNETEDLTGTGWETTGFDDSGWPVGEALFYLDSDPVNGPTNTPMADVPLTAYFRAWFQYDGPMDGLRLAYQPMVDDGAVVYLNGVEVDRLRMPSNGAIEYSTRARAAVTAARLEAPRVLPASALQSGPNLVTVEVHQISSTSGDVVFGLSLQATLTHTNTAAVPVVINEVVAAGRPETLAEGSGDWIELYNASSEAYDLSGMSLTDTTADPRRYVFPSGFILQEGERRRLACNDQSPAAVDNTGYALGRGGDALYLFQRLSEGGGLADSVVFGLQPEGYSLARVPDAFGDWQLALPTPEAPNLAVTLAGVEALRINEWASNPRNGEDWFELFNPQGQPVDLGGCFLTDDLLEREKQQIAPLSFVGAGPTGYAVFVADGQPGQGADHVDFRLEAAGESLGLYRADGVPVDRVTFGPQTVGAGEGRFPDGAGTIVTFSLSLSRGEPNWLPHDSVHINEVLAHTDPPLEDAIELWNNGAMSVDVGGWYLSNSRTDLQRYRVPDGTVIEAGDYTVLYEGAFGHPASPSAFTFNSARGDQAVLSSANSMGELTGYRVVVEFGASANGVSFGRTVTSVGSDFAPMLQRTFGVDQPVSVEEFRAGNGAVNARPQVGPVVISELMVQPPSVIGTNDNVFDEYVELQNLLTVPQVLHDPLIPTNTWQLDGGVRYAFPPGVVMAPEEAVVVVSFDPIGDAAMLTAFRGQYGLTDVVRVFGPYEGQLSNLGETLRLLKPDPPQLPPHPDAGLVPAVLVESVSYQLTPPWPLDVAGTGLSFQRELANAYGNEPMNWIAAAPGPGLPAPVGVDPDIDEDGLPDAWETQFWSDPGHPDASPELDPDHDGLTNHEEWLAGTVPTEKASRLAVESLLETGNGWALQFQAVAGRDYTVEVLDDRLTGEWRRLLDVETVAEDILLEVVDSELGVGTRYYRVLTPRQP